MNQLAVSRPWETGVNDQLLQGTSSDVELSCDAGRTGLEWMTSSLCQDLGGLGRMNQLLRGTSSGVESS